MNMKLRLLGAKRYILLIIASLLLSGCTIDNRYAAEKALWKAEQDIKKIIDKTSGKPKDRDLSEIISAYRKVVDKYPLEPLSAKTQFAIASAYLSWNKPEEAQRELKKVIQNFSGQPQIAARAQFAIGKIFESQGKTAEALSEYEKVTDIYPLSNDGLESPLYIIRMQKNLKNKEGEERAYRNAARHYKKLIDEYSDTDIALYVRDYLARTQVEEGDWQSAISLWDEIVAKAPESSMALKAFLARAEIYATKLNDLKKAVSIYEEFTERYPKSGVIQQARFRLGELYLLSNEPSKAKDIFSGIIKESSKDEELTIRARLAYIETLKRQKLTDEVIAEYKKIEELYPKNPLSLGIPFLISRFYAEIKDTALAAKTLDQAASEYEKRLASSGNDNEHRAIARLLMLCYNDARSWDKLLKLLGDLSDRFQNDPSFLMAMASLYQTQLRQPEKAVATYQKILERFPENERFVKMAQAQIESLKRPSSEPKIEN